MKMSSLLFDWPRSRILHHNLRCMFSVKCTQHIIHTFPLSVVKILPMIERVSNVKILCGGNANMFITISSEQRLPLSRLEVAIVTFASSRSSSSRYDFNHGNKQGRMSTEQNWPGAPGLL